MQCQVTILLQGSPAQENEMFGLQSLWFSQMFHQDQLLSGCLCEEMWPPQETPSQQEPGWKVVCGTGKQEGEQGKWVVFCV